MKKIALREGFGDLLAKGWEKAAKEIGKGAERYLITLKGSPVTGDLRYGFAFPLSYLTATRGADHLKGAPMAEMVEGMMPEIDGVLAKEIFGIPTMNPESTEGKEKMVRWYENLCSVIDSLGTCKFASVYQLGLKGGLDFGDYAKMLTQATGIDYDAERLFEIGERIYRLEMAYNVREGLRREDFKVPPRFTEDEIPSGPLKGAKLDLAKINQLLDAYFELRGFDPKTALPKRSGLEEVGLNWVADDLERRGLLAKG